MLSTKNHRFKFLKKIQDYFIGQFDMLKQVGPTAYHLDLSHITTLKIIHVVFHVSLLKDSKNNGLR